MEVDLASGKVLQHNAELADALSYNSYHEILIPKIAPSSPRIMADYDRRNGGGRGGYNNRKRRYRGRSSMLCGLLGIELTCRSS